MDLVLDRYQGFKVEDKVCVTWVLCVAYLSPDSPDLRYLVVLYLEIHKQPFGIVTDGKVLRDSDGYTFFLEVGTVRVRPISPSLRHMNRTVFDTGRGDQIFVRPYLWLALRRVSLSSTSVSSISYFCPRNSVDECSK